MGNPYLGIKTGVLEWRFKEEINRTWYSTGRTFEIETVYKGACGRMISETRDMELDNENNLMNTLHLPDNVECISSMPYSLYDRVTPPRPELPCTECLVLYAERLANFTDKSRKAARKARSKRRVMKPKHKSGRKRKQDLLNIFEQEQLRQVKRLAGRQIVDKLLPWD
jgi:hypothetical protein